MLDLVVERVECLVPEPVQVASQLDESTNLDAVNAAHAVAPLRHQPGVFENLQMLRDGRPADRQRLGERTHRRRTLLQTLENLPACGVSESLKCLFVSHYLP